MNIKYPLAMPFFGGRELEYIKSCLNSGWIAHGGPFSKKLIREIKSFTGASYASLQSSCTASLHASLLALGIDPGDEIIVADFTYPATGHAVRMCGAEPVFVDVAEDTYNINPASIKSALTEKTKGIIPVHLFGAPCEIKDIVTIAKKNDLRVIEDCACAFGASVDGRHVGTFGDVGLFSLHARKGITTGEGGFSICDDSILSERIESYSMFGINKVIENGLLKCKFTKLGFNYKFSDLQAAAGLAQIEKVRDYIEKRRLLANYYLNVLDDIDGLQLPCPASGHVWQSFVVRVDTNINRDKLILNLLKVGVQTQIGTYASHLEPVYESNQTCPISANLFRKTLALPFYFGLQTKDIDEICSILKNCIARSKC